MTVAFGAIGTGANGSTSVAPSYPAGITAGQLLLCVVTSGATNSETPATPSGWFLLATGASTDGTYGVDAGPRRVTVFGRVADGSESGTLTVNITNGGTCRGTISRFTSSIGRGWALQALGSHDSTSGTGFSAAVGSINWATGDCAMVAVGQRVDTATQSSQSLTASGTTFGTRTNQASTAVTTGNDHRHVVDTFAAVTTGGGSATTTWAYTASAACSGGVVVVRIREIGNVAESIGFSDTQDSALIFAAQRTNEALIGGAVQGSTLARRAALAESSSVIHNKSAAETFTLSAAQAEISTLNELQAESLTFTPAEAEQSTLPRLRAESIGFGDGQASSLNAVINKAQAESLTFTGAQSGAATFPETRAESIGFSDGQFIPAERAHNVALVGLAGAGVARWLRGDGPGLKEHSESIGFTDSQSEASARNVSRAESIGFTEAQTQFGKNAARAESFALTDTRSEQSTVTSQRAESIGFSDLQVATTGSDKIHSESFSLSESIIGQKNYFGSMLESFSLGDEQTKLFTQLGNKINTLLVGERRESAFQAWAMDAFFSKERAESIGFTDAVLAVSSLTSGRTETFALSDAQSELGTFAKATSEAFSLSAAQSGSNGILFVKGQPEVFGLTDASAEQSTVNSERQETIGLTDVAALAANIGVTREESIGFDDTSIQSLQPIYNLNRADALSFSSHQAASLNPVYIVQGQEAIGLSDTPSQIPSLNSSKFETIGLSDTPSSIGAFQRFMAETLGFGDQQFIVTGPFSEHYRYDFSAGDLHYDIPAQDLTYEVPADELTGEAS